MSRSGVLVVLAGLFGATAVALGAWSTHGLAAIVGERGAGLLDTAVRYQFQHALSMLAAVVLHRFSGPGIAWFAHAARAFALGIVLFCGSLHLLAFGAPRWLGAVAPVGGLALMLGWLLLMVGGWRLRERGG